MPAQADTVSVTTDEERAVRDAVAAIAGSFRPDDHQQHVDGGVNCAELWDALGAKGYLGVHLPERYGVGALIHGRSPSSCRRQLLMGALGSRDAGAKEHRLKPVLGDRPPALSPVTARCNRSTSA
jgi:alkylation response protein AidB-like acyl-CoA dehydrogenase